MLWSKMFIPTLREEPANADAASHRLFLRAGYIRQLTAGVYSLLPIAQRVRLKIIAIIREEMNRIGAQEFLLPSLQPMELWEESGRKDTVAEIMFKLTDRKRAALALGLTHEEVFTTIARAGLSSYKQLPQFWYQIHTKFRDEARPKGGLLRTREFTMKDSYSFDMDEIGLDRSYQLHHSAYIEIFQRCGLQFIPVQAHSGAMGGSASTEFMVVTDAGEDSLVLCNSCDYAANLERAESAVKKETAEEQEQALQEFPTPGIRTIKELESFDQSATADRQIKTLIYANNGRLVIALLRGDQELNETKLQSALKSVVVAPATEEQIHAAMGAHPGSLGACGVKSGSDAKITAVLADMRLRGRINMVTGANKDDLHLRGVSVERDLQVDQFVDLHKVKEGEICVNCGGVLRLAKGLEIGHIFKLGTRYSDCMDANVLSSDGSKTPLNMGSYGIGVERLMAAVAEQMHDKKGLRWPVSIAPFHVIIVLVNVADQAQREVAERLYSELTSAKVEVLFDDRDERAGVKFNDAELIGVPFRITVGKKVADGVVELLDRSCGVAQDVKIPDVERIVRGLTLENELANKPAIR